MIIILLSSLLVIISISLIFMSYLYYSAERDNVKLKKVNNQLKEALSNMVILGGVPLWEKLVKRTERKK